MSGIDVVRGLPRRNQPKQRVEFTIEEVDEFSVELVEDQFVLLMAKAVFPGSTYEELAARYLIKVGTVKSRLNRGRLRLNYLLERKEFAKTQEGKDAKAS